MRSSPGALARTTGELDRPGSQPLASAEITTPRVAEGYTPSLADFVVPMGTLIAVAITPFFVLGEVWIVEAFGLALLTAIILAVLKGMPLREALDGFVEGCKGVTIGAVILGISPDPVEDVKAFAEKYQLNFPLLADADHKVCEAYGVWQERSMAGRPAKARCASRSRAAARPAVAHPHAACLRPEIARRARDASTSGRRLGKKSFKSPLKLSMGEISSNNSSNASSPRPRTSSISPRTRSSTTGSNKLECPAISSSRAA